MGNRKADISIIIQNFDRKHLFYNQLKLNQIKIETRRVLQQLFQCILNTTLRQE